MTVEERIALKIGRDALQIIRLEALLADAQAELEKQTAEPEPPPAVKGRKR